MKSIITWEVQYRPFPSSPSEQEMDEISDRIADAVYAAGDDRLPVLSGWDHLLVSANLRDGYVTVIAEDPEEPGIRMGHFQQAVASMVAHLGMEGYLHADRVISVYQEQDV